MNYHYYYPGVGLISSFYKLGPIDDRFYSGVSDDHRLIPPDSKHWRLLDRASLSARDRTIIVSNPGKHLLSNQGLQQLREDSRYLYYSWYIEKEEQMTSLPEQVTVKLDKQTQEQLDQILNHLADLNSAANPKLARKAGGFLFSALKSKLMWAATLALLGYLGITGKVSDWQLPELYPVIREVVEYNAETGEITIDNRGVLEHIIFDDGKFFSNSGSPVEDGYYDQLKKSLNNVTDKFEFPKQRSIWR